MGRKILILLMLLLLFCSCSKNEETDYKELLNNNEYQKIYEVSSKSLLNGIEQETLYYKAVSEYYLNLSDAAVEDSILYLSLYSSRPTINRILLLKGDPKDAYVAGKELWKEGEMRKADKIQFLGILATLGIEEEGNDVLLDIKNTLGAYEYAQAVISSRLASSTISDALYDLYIKNSISQEFLSLIKNALSLMGERGDFDIAENLINRTFNYNPTYSLILGDYYYNRGKNVEAQRYWINAIESYPEEYKQREVLLH